MSIPSSFIDRLLSTVSIVDIINRRVQLERTGGRYKAKCPFHGDGNENKKTNIKPELEEE